MPLTWRQRLDQAPHLRQFDTWPAIPLDSVPRLRRKRFLVNQQMVAEALAGAPLHTVATRHAVTPGQVTHLLNRCLGGDADADPPLSQGCIPHQVVNPKRRTSPLPVLAHKGGASCAFQALLANVPGLRDGLNAEIKSGLDEEDFAQRLSPYAAHGEFKRLLAEAHWPRDRYPYTTKSLAYQSVRRYLYSHSDDLVRESQAKRKRPSRTLRLESTRCRAQRATQIDEHPLDLSNKVHLVLNDELIPLRLARATVIVAIDVDTHCVLGYHVAPTRHPNHQDLLILLEGCIAPWQPLALATPGLAYTPGAAFPSGLPNAFPVSFGDVAMDNAWMHRANPVTVFLCDQFGATVGLGLPAQPTIRGLVESVFDYVNVHLSHRAPSTTGSHPKDAKREARKNRKKPPVITYQTLIEALSVLLTHYNVTPQAALGGASPLALFQAHCANQYVRYIPETLRRQWQPFLREAVVRLHWNRHEHRAPHINFYQVRYQGSGLLPVAGRITHIRVQYDWRDIRTLHAWTLTGEDLGELRASRSWQRFPHSLATRQYILKQVQIHRLNQRDPMASFFRYLLEHKGSPKYALSLLRVYDEMTAGGSIPLYLDGEPGGAATPNASESIVGNHWQWHPDLANHRE